MLGWSTRLGPRGSTMAEDFQMIGRVAATEENLTRLSQERVGGAGVMIDEDRRGALLGSVPERGGVPPRGGALVEDSLELGCCTAGTSIGPARAARRRRASPGACIGHNRDRARAAPCCAVSIRRSRTILARRTPWWCGGVGWRSSTRRDPGREMHDSGSLLASPREHVWTRIQLSRSVAQRGSFFSMRFSFSCPPGQHGEERDSYIP